jgi:protein SCO1
MTRSSGSSAGSVTGGRHLHGGPGLLLGAIVLIGCLVLLTAVRSVGPSGPGASASSADPAAYLVSAPGPAPALALTDQDERPFDLSAVRGVPVFVFFGYTHCPDVCPATVGTVGQAMEAYGSPVRAVFVTIDPERDTPAWLREYARYLETGFSAVTGTPDRIAAVAAAWGVRYAKVETGTPGEYSMSHTADVVLIDAQGNLRARFPFGTSAAAMTATLRAVTASTPSPSPASKPSSSAASTSLAIATPSAIPNAPSPSPSTAPPAAAGLTVLVDSSSVWAGPAGPVILGLSANGAPIDDSDLVASAQLTTIDGAPVGPAVPTVAVRPPGETRVLYVASPAIPTPGWWRLMVTAERGGFTLTGSTDVAALDPGTTAAIGAPAPAVHTPTLDDVGGVAKAVTTDPAPDLRLSRTSTTDALAARQPFVLVIDSWKFRVTSACGKALVMARYLVDRWPGDAFIHLEPLRYDVVTDTPVLEGSLGDPTLTDAAAGWGLAGDPWGATSMPWIFVVDGNGIVRAKAEGVLGTDDVDVILALIAAGD